VQLNQEFYKNPACISALASVLANSPEFAVGLDRVTFSLLLISTFQVRQLAAVELRKRVSQNSGNFWTLLPQNEREEIKAKLPELILAESKSVLIFSCLFLPLISTLLCSNLVRHSAARVIAAIATIEVPQGTWVQLLPFLQQTCISPQVAHREVGSFILFTVLESIVEGFQSHMSSLFDLFRTLLADPESIDVRITTVRRVTYFIPLSELYLS
jgi:hypothetical protein